MIFGHNCPCLGVIASPGCRFVRRRCLSPSVMCLSHLPCCCCPPQLFTTSCMLRNEHPIPSASGIASPSAPPPPPLSPIQDVSSASWALCVCYLENLFWYGPQLSADGVPVHYCYLIPPQASLCTFSGALLCFRYFSSSFSSEQLSSPASSPALLLLLSLLACCSSHCSASLFCFTRNTTQTGRRTYAATLVAYIDKPAATHSYPPKSFPHYTHDCCCR
ncbi:hypothetical protein FN846DRAFT_62019 [Sphaerosporella brunnea]|uniref:Uncharacterized protein n=1 Tax=Sphaerosporella brunnea TaxID=1250544 RepID=A0A5J5F906_9PEZI|nr:hypothetical protein FN846DRAFT_62019 [Sphaerosporella brunnea]